MSPVEPPRPADGKTLSLFCPSGFGLKIGSVHPFQGLFRPFVGQPCQSCNPNSLMNFFYKRHAEMKFRNALHITEEDTRYRGWLVRRLCHVLFVWERPAGQDLSVEWSEKIWKHPRIQSAIEKEKDDNDKPTVSASSESRKEVLRHLEHIQKPLSPRLIRITWWILVKLLNRLYLNLQIQCGQLATLKEVSDAHPRTPLVLLSTHPSWLDFFVVPFILFSQNLRLPRVVWDRTDCSPLIRWFLQKFGVVFIPPNGSSKHLEEAVLSVYIETLLTEGQHVLVFLESTSSPNCRKVSPVAHEWVLQMISAVRSGVVSDILIAPVGISYDTCPESSGSGRELASFLGLLRFLTSAFCPWSSSLGCARVDFAQPLSLEEYIINYTLRHSALVPCLKKTLLPQILDTRNSMFDEMALESNLGAPDEQEEALVDGFLLHSLRAAVSCTAVMSSHIVSALLLHKYKEGVSLSRLLCEFPEMIRDILHHGFDVGFTGQRWDILRHSLYLLRHSIVLYSVPSDDVFVLHRESPDSLRALAVKSSSLLPIFLYEAVGACVIRALLAQIPSLCLVEMVEVLFAEDEIINLIMCLCSLLHRDILLQPPCQSVHLLCHDILEKLVYCGLLSMYEDPSAPQACDTRRTCFADQLMWKDLDDLSDSDSIGEKIKRHYKLCRSPHLADVFVFLCDLLNPVLKTYERAALFLQERGMCGDELETDYVTRLHQYLLQKADEDCSYECAERSLAACAVRTFIDLGLQLLAYTQLAPWDQSVFLLFAS
ncbi:glycerol-3-phosphate acyltransferase 2, mitochondrial [Bufo bufo]|uniref:glycerol-3-phosphate acyltransferase 2, mitochondrial n=1 Tax=Bufo bufo TaxID=8384 RepID=UPI001ABE9611|nr:glycerol-3-phosphate acyltransferase 2, mitochondrial [Bufo bufo]